MSAGEAARAQAVLFVCTGNICRSPTAEAVFRAHVKRAGLASSITIDSAGTHDFQLGQRPDPRAAARARLRGYELGSRCARQIELEDFDRFDWILAMDRFNLGHLEALRPHGFRGYLGLFLDFAPEAGVPEVPDPYGGETKDFDRVLDLVEHAAEGLLETMRKRLDDPRRR